MGTERKNIILNGKQNAWSRKEDTLIVHILDTFMYYTHTPDLQCAVSQPFTGRVHTAQHNTQSTSSRACIDKIRSAKTTQWITRNRWSPKEFVCKDYTWATAKNANKPLDAQRHAIIQINGRHSGQRHSNPDIQPLLSPKPNNPTTIHLQPSLYGGENHLPSKKDLEQKLKPWSLSPSNTMGTICVM